MNTLTVDEKGNIEATVTVRVIGTITNTKHSDSNCYILDAYDDHYIVLFLQAKNATAFYFKDLCEYHTIMLFKHKYHDSQLGE